MNQAEFSVLVVDDDVDTCRNLADILGDFGYRVQTAHDGRQALELVRRQAFDLALLDLKMPDMDGLTLYRKIKQLRSEIVAMIISAYASAATAEEAAQAGAWRVLSKPLDVAGLIPLVQQAADRPLVLVVDDDPDLCSNLVDVLNDQGYRVRVAHDESQTSQYVGQAAHRVVLIDMKLPDGDGRSVFRLVRAADPQARVVLITGHGAELQSLLEQILAEGADAVCYKPFDMRELLNTVRRLALKKELQQ